MASKYALQIVNLETREVVRWSPGSLVEATLITEHIRRAKAHGVGLFRTEAAVERAMQTAWDELLLDLKQMVIRGTRP